ncbi:MAG: thioredoxin-disulfide reductase [Candidatus Heimdallarchaeota archaeon]
MVENVVIIGGGPAGYTSAIYTSRADLKPILIEEKVAGGQLAITTEVENYPGFPEGIQGPDYGKAVESQAKRFGTRIIQDRVIEVDFSKSPFMIKSYSHEIQAKAVIVATGSDPRKIGIPGEEEYAGAGVSYCATCDGAFFRDMALAVVGGGDSAMEESSFLTKFASKVYIIHRRDELRASKIMQKRAFDNPKIEILWDSIPLEVLGSGGDFDAMAKLRIRNVKDNSETDLEVQGLFVAIGHIPNTDLFGGQLSLDVNGYIITDERMRTNIPGIFAAGDVRDAPPHGYRQAITAAGMGCAAAIEVERYLVSLED